MAKTRIRIVNPLAFLRFILIVVLIIAGVVFGLSKLSGPNIKSKIQKAEDAKITIIRSYIACYDADGNEVVDGSEVTQGQTLVFNCVYNFKNNSTGSIDNYFVTADSTKDSTPKYIVSSKLKVTVDDTAFATVMKNGSIVIPDGITSDHEIKVTVTFDKTEKTYTFTVKAMETSTEGN